jgi:hypothetical protein
MVGDDGGDCLGGLVVAHRALLAPKFCVELVLASSLGTVRLVLALAAEPVEREQEEAEMSRKMLAAITTALSGSARRGRLSSKIVNAPKVPSPTTA